MIYVDSTTRAGRYAQRYRVIHPDGRTRWIHSQWEVKNGPSGMPDRAIGIMMDDTEAYDSARALGDVSAQLKIAVDLGNIAIWRHDLRTQRMYYSDRAFELLQHGAAPRGPVDRRDARADPSRRPARWSLASAEQALRTDQPTDMEARYRRTDGSWRYVHDAPCRRARRRRRAARLRRRRARRDRARSSTGATPRSWRAGSRPPRAPPASACGRRRTNPRETDWNAQMFDIFDAVAPPRVPSFTEWLSAMRPRRRPRARRQRDRRPTSRSGDGPLRDRVPHPAPRRQRALGRDARRSSTAQPPSRARILGVAMDVTEQHAALDALRDASERVALIARHAGIGMWEATPRRLARALGRADVPPARPRAARRGAGPRRADGAGPSRRSAASRSIAPSSELGALRHRVRVPLRLPDGSWRWLASRSALVLRRERPAGAPGRRQLGRHRSQGGRARAPAGGAGRARDPGQVAVPLAHEPRAAHAAQRGARLHPAAADRGPPARRMPSSSPSSATSAPPATTCSR